MKAKLRKPLLISALAVLAVVVSFGCDNPSNESDDSAATARAEAPSAEEAAEQAPKTRTAKHTDRYGLRSPEQAIGAGKKQKVQLAVTPADGLKINKEFPWKIEFSQPEGIALAQTTFSKAQIDLAEKQATMNVFVEAEQAGDHKLEATGNFSVCNDTECYVIRDEPLDFKLAVADDEQADPVPEEQEAQPSP